MGAFYCQKKGLGFRVFSACLAFIFTSTLVFPPNSFSQSLPVSLPHLPAPGMMVAPSNAFAPPIIRGLKIHPDNPLRFDFIVDTGDNNLKGQPFSDEATKLIKYFLASLTVPEDEFWVNLSPYEKNRIIPEGLGATEMGRDLLSQDYLLKQLTASLIYPEDELGSAFWQKVRQKAKALYGTEEIPMNTFNKVWIVPDKAVVYEHGTSVFVGERHLKVMLEDDYLAMRRSEQWTVDSDQKKNPKNDTKNLATDHRPLITDIIRELVIPEIEHEVNHGEAFAQLRQIFNSMILATWYKKSLKTSLLGQVYMNQNKIKGVDVKDKDIKHKIYNQYLDAFKKGVYDYIKEDYDPIKQQIVTRKYFSGGVDAGVVKVRSLEVRDLAGASDAAMIVGPESKRGRNEVVTTDLAESTEDTFDQGRIGPDAAMMTEYNADQLANDSHSPLDIFLDQPRFSKYRTQIKSTDRVNKYIASIFHEYSLFSDIDRFLNSGEIKIKPDQKPFIADLLYFSQEAYGDTEYSQDARIFLWKLGEMAFDNLFEEVAAEGDLDEFFGDPFPIGENRPHSVNSEKYAYLDIAAGTRAAEYFRSLKGRRTIVNDISYFVEAFLNQAKKELLSDGGEYIEIRRLDVRDLNSLLKEDYYAHIHLSNIQNYVNFTDPDQAFRTLFSRVVPGGTISVGTFLEHKMMLESLPGLDNKDLGARAREFLSADEYAWAKHYVGQTEGWVLIEEGIYDEDEKFYALYQRQDNGDNTPTDAAMMSRDDARLQIEEFLKTIESDKVGMQAAYSLDGYSEAWMNNAIDLLQAIDGHKSYDPFPIEGEYFNYTKSDITTDFNVKLNRSSTNTSLFLSIVSEITRKYFKDEYLKDRDVYVKDIKSLTSSQFLDFIYTQWNAQSIYDQERYYRYRHKLHSILHNKEDDFVTSNRDDILEELNSGADFESLLYTILNNGIPGPDYIPNLRALDQAVKDGRVEQEDILKIVFNDGWGVDDEAEIFFGKVGRKEGKGVIGEWYVEDPEGERIEDGGRINHIILEKAIVQPPDAAMVATAQRLLDELSEFENQDLLTVQFFLKLRQLLGFESDEANAELTSLLVDQLLPAFVKKLEADQQALMEKGFRSVFYEKLFDGFKYSVDQFFDNHQENKATSANLVAVKEGAERLFVQFYNAIFEATQNTGIRWQDDNEIQSIILRIHQHSASIVLLVQQLRNSMFDTNVSILEEYNISNLQDPESFYPRVRDSVEENFEPVPNIFGFTDSRELEIAFDLGKVFSELTINAFDNRKNESRKLESRFDQESNEVVLIIENEGPLLVSEEDAFGWYKSFSQEGVWGIGLPLSRLIVEAHGGTLSLKEDNGIVRAEMRIPIQSDFAVETVDPNADSARDNRPDAAMMGSLADQIREVSRVLYGGRYFPQNVTVAILNGIDWKQLYDELEPVVETAQEIDFLTNDYYPGHHKAVEYAQELWGVIENHSSDDITSRNVQKIFARHIFTNRQKIVHYLQKISLVELDEKVVLDALDLIPIHSMLNELHDVARINEGMSRDSQAYQELEFATQVALEAHFELRNFQDLKVEKKIDKTDVTPADKELNELFVRRLSERFSLPIIAEESENSEDIVQTGNYITVDPIDGTSRFIKVVNDGVTDDGYDHLSLVSLVKDGEPIMGIILNHFTGQLSVAYAQGEQKFESHIQIADHSNLNFKGRSLDDKFQEINQEAPWLIGSPAAKDDVNKALIQSMPKVVVGTKVARVVVLADERVKSGVFYDPANSKVSIWDLAAAVPFATLNGITLLNGEDGSEIEFNREIKLTNPVVAIKGDQSLVDQVFEIMNNFDPTDKAMVAGNGARTVKARFNLAQTVEYIEKLFREDPGRKKFPTLKELEEALGPSHVTFLRHYSDILSALEQKISQPGYDEALKRRIQAAIELKKDVATAAADYTEAVFEENKTRKKIPGKTELATALGLDRRTLYRDANYSRMISKLEQRISKPGYDQALKERIEQAIIDKKEKDRRSAAKKDEAMVGDATKGGIDFNAGSLDLQIKRDGNGVPFPVFEQPLERINIQGFTPVIINIAPMNMMPFLGLADPEDKPTNNELTYNLSLGPADRKKQN